MTDQIILLIALVLFSGFFSSAETALFSISKVKARHLAKAKGKANKLIKKMKEDPHKLLSTILIGNNLVNVAASALATAITIDIVSSHAVGIATGIMTFIILIFGEIFPKSVATQNNILIARLVIIPLYWLSILFSPLILFLNFIPRLTGKIKKKPKVTEEELMTFVEAVEEEGEIKEQEKELIHNIFEFDDTNASEIMTPRADMFVIDAEEKLDLETYNLEDADTVVLSFGAAARPSYQAVQTVKEKRKAVGFIRLKTLWPLPEVHLKELLKNVHRVLVVEMNMGMMVNEIARVACHATVESVPKVAGEVHHSDEIFERIREADAA